MEWSFLPNALRHFKIYCAYIPSKVNVILEMICLGSYSNHVRGSFSLRMNFSLNIKALYGLNPRIHNASYRLSSLK